MFWWRKGRREARIRRMRRSRRTEREDKVTEGQPVQIVCTGTMDYTTIHALEWGLPRKFAAVRLAGVFVARKTTKL
jgi:hypothetical protein